MDSIFAWDKTHGQIVYRILGHCHGDGQIDSDESPVWLLAGDQNPESHTSLPDVAVG